MKKNKRILFIFLGFLLIFCCFIYLLLRPSAEAKAISELDLCSTPEDVKTCWQRHRFDLLGGDEKSDILSSDYLQSVRTKLNSMHLKQKEIDAINEWLPATENLNVIVVPDLSGRIKDENNNPKQVNNDTAILNQIWNSFEKATFLKMDSKDKLMVDVSDRSQAQGDFRSIANNLIFDLSLHKGKSNRLYFGGKKEVFQQGISTLYSTALEKTSGADYVYYFKEILSGRLKQNTIEDKYRNVLIILTDGYLEATRNSNTVVITPTPFQLQQLSEGFQVPIKLPLSTETSFENLEVYVYEVNERQYGIGKHFSGLKKWWTEWFKSMKVKNAEDKDMFNRREDALNTSFQKIEQVFK